MNQSALKTFAQETRRKLRDLIGGRLDYVLSADTAELRQQAAQVNELRAALKNEGSDQLIERVAYTWFNRLAALRFMDANGYHPFGARVITPATANETLPELLQQTRAGVLDADFKSQIANPKTFDDILAGRIPVENVEAHIYRLLLVAACNYYHQLMPFMFERIGDATELLLPVDLLTQHSIVADFRENLTDDDCRNEEVLGWFYQYYISEKKAEVDARKAEVPKEDIPAKTQLFTPHWIVRYLVENSLGRLWLLNRPHSKLREKMPYYIEGEAEKDFLKITKPEEIRLLDPAGGSGHMLTYAFDLLYAIYEEEGYDAPEIPGLILRHNLYGVDICDRAVALATFALCMKARAKDNRFFRRVVQPHLISLQEIRFDEGELSAYFKAIGLQPSAINPQLTKLLFQFEEAKNFGSLIQPCLSESEIFAAREKLSTLNTEMLARDLTVAFTHTNVLRVLEQAMFLCPRYQVVVTNPPYLGSAAFNTSLKHFAETHFTDGRTDLFALFISRLALLSKTGGYVSMVTMQSWLFLASYEDLRKEALTKWCFTSLIHLGARAFDSLSGEVVQTAAFILRTTRSSDGHGLFIRLLAGRNEAEKDAALLAAINDPKSLLRFTASADELLQIPGCPVAYWIGSGVIKAFKFGRQLEDIAPVRQGFQTGDNDRFMRMWSEVAKNKCKFDALSKEQVFAARKKWVPYNKGGSFRRWYGNNEYLVAFDEENYEILSRSGNCLPSRQLYFKKAITWSALASGDFGARLSPEGFTFSAKGACAFPDPVYFHLALGLLNSTVAGKVFEFYAATLDFNVGSIRKVPLLADNSYDLNAIRQQVDGLVEIGNADWDNFETSWNFRELPLLRSDLKKATLAASWQNWKGHCDTAIHRMQKLETENNRLFIAAYGLQDEIKPDVSADQITLARADAHEDMAAFLSYAVGCMMGRYSLDHPGLILADAGATAQDYLAKIPKPTFAPDADGIIPVLDGEWFTDDIVGRFREFLRVTFGDATLAENLTFIEASLGKELPKYFARDFYKDHLKTYKKRPIYWMFSSPDGSFQALIYLHRYNRDTVSVLLNEYVREFIGKLEEKHRQQTIVTLNESARPGDRTKAAKEIGKIDKMLKEIRAWERDVLLPLRSNASKLTSMTA
ncbi:MAG: BREX-1 system adenine-specific DNA-methyltransferase PglX [Verrucomicrobiota bacterium]